MQARLNREDLESIAAQLAFTAAGRGNYRITYTTNEGGLLGKVPRTILVEGLGAAKQVLAWIEADPSTTLTDQNW